MMLSQETCIVLQYCSKIGLEKGIKSFSNAQWFDLEAKLEKHQKNIMELNDFSIEKLQMMAIRSEMSEMIIQLRRSIKATLNHYSQEFDLQVISYLDTMLYPKQLKEKMGNSMPLTIFCIGNLDLLLDEIPKLAIVGMRNCEKRTQESCREIVRKCIQNNICIVSGGARGIDSIAQQTVSDEQGSMIIVLPYGVLTKEARDICEKQKGKFLLLSIAEPDQVFSSYQALNRNALIYALCTHALIMQAGNGTGGTWKGATRALRQSLCQIGVWDDCTLVGNQRLAHMGAKRLVKENVLSWFFNNNEVKIR